MSIKLACLGGTPVCLESPETLRWPTGGELEREALLRVLASGTWGTLGPENAAFSEEYAKYCHARYALPVLNGTVSLELLLRALGIGRGDEVIVPPYTFTASVTAIALVGAMPVFADIDPDTYTISPESTEAAITERTRAIIGVHLGGRPFDVDAIKAIADRHGLHLIEDAAHAHGSEWQGRRVGSLGTAGSFSFQASKNISCGEGGAITTNDEALYQRLWGIHHNGRKYGEYGYDHPYLGTDARLAEWQCAMLRARMARLDADIDRRMDSARYLDEQLAQFPFFRAMKPDQRITRNGLHLYSFKYLEEGLKGLSRSVFLKALAAENVCMAADGYSQPIYELEFLRTAAFEKAAGCAFIPPKPETMPHNERAAKKEGAWLYHSSLLGERRDIDKIIEAFAKIQQQADELLAVERKEGMEHA